jgi:uncharacterized protein (DUF2164 family)
MTITVSSETQQRMIASIKEYFLEQMDDEVGELKASMLLEFFLREIGPTVYNKAIRDAQTQMQERVADLEGSCHEPEFSYWDR